MYKRVVPGLLMLLVPSVCLAQGTQESYLPSKSQLYFRFDGMAMHQAAFDKSAVGKMMKGDTGKFLKEFWKFTYDNLETAAAKEPKIVPMLKDFTKLVATMHDNGIVLGVAVDQAMPPQAQAVIVFPKAAGESGTLLPLIQKIAEETKAKVKSSKVGNRFVNQIDLQMVQVGWWAQGDDAILTIGTTDPVSYAKDIDAKKTGLAKHPLYVKTAGFKEFTTASRGYFDLSAILAVVGDVHPQAPAIIDELGLKGIKSVTFASGFDGPAERSVVDVDMPGPRKGLLGLASQKKITLKDLPVLPRDLTGFNAGTIALNKSYDVVINLIEGVMKVVAPNEVDNVKDAIKAFQGAVGVDISKDLFSHFGDVVVSYNSPSDGFLGTGAVVAIQIKDGAKLSKTLEKLVKAIPATPGGEVSLTKKAYKNGEIMQLQMVGGQVNAQMATFGIYKDWFVYSQYPQPVKGFIMRQEGELPAWKADEDLTKALGQFPSEFNSIQVSDPRPIVKTVVSILPFAINIINSVGTPFVPGFRPFDLDLIPHAEEASRHLFPNVTVGTDDGKRIRTETRGSLLLPF